MRGRTGSSAWIGGGFALGLWSLPGLAYAQAAPPPPAPVPANVRANAGVPTREEVVPPPAPVIKPGPRLKIEGDIERSPCPLADPAYKDLRVTITGATFNNLKGVSPEDLAPAYRPYLGQDKPVAAICDIRDAAATILRRRGYLAAVQVPTQRIEGGTVRFEVIYARVVAVRVRGDAGRTEGLIASYLNNLTRDEVFNRYAAERYLLLARDLPGYEVRLALRPAGTGAGDLVGDVTVVRTPFDADFNIQNYAAKDTGRFGGQFREQIYGLTGLGDRTSVAFYSTADFKEQQILQLGHDFRLGSEGLTLGGHYTYAWTRPDIAAGKLRARTLFANAEASYPFVRSQRLNLRGAGGFDFVNQDVRFAGTRLSRDRLRVAYLRLDGDATDVSDRAVPSWRLSGSLELRQGLKILDASSGPLSHGVAPSRADGDAGGTLVRFAGALDVAVTRDITLTFAPRAQYSFDPLLSFEEFSAGSYTVGRGYDPGTLIGDSGYGATGELRLNRLKPFRRLDMIFQPFVFVDHALIWNKNRANDPQRLVSLGGGVRASFANRFRLDVTVATPARRAGFETRRPGTRVLVSLTMKLLPWGAR